MYIYLGMFLRYVLAFGTRVFKNLRSGTRVLTDPFFQ